MGDKMENKDKEPKLPMYYEQIYGLLKLMAKLYIGGQSFPYYRVVKQFYSRVRPDLSEDKKRYYDEKIKELSKNIPTVNIRRHQTEYHELWQKMGGEAYLVEQELLQDVEKQTDIFKVLKHNTEELELI